MGGERGARTVALRRSLLAVAVVLAGAFPASDAEAQGAERFVEIEDLGFTSPIACGARAAAMAGAFVVTGDDLSSLLYNPAGLARIKRLDVTLGVYSERHEAEETFYGAPAGIDTRSGSIELAGAAFPFPVYRGSVVVAAAVSRPYSANLDMHYRGYNAEEGTFDNYLLQQSGSVQAYNVGFGVDLSAAFSGGIAGYVLDGSVQTLRQFDYTVLATQPTLEVYVSEDVGLDLRGFGVRVGGQFFVHRFVQVGVAYTSPTWVEARGDRLVEVVEHVENAIDRFTQSYEPVSASYLLPSRLDFGAAVTLSWLSIAGEAAYVDWTAAAADRRRFRASNLETIFREVFDVRVGAEATLPWAPVRVRGGYARRPFATTFVHEDRITNDKVAKSTVETERHEWSAGAGTVVGSALALDAAVTVTTGTRSTERLTDRRQSSRYLLTASYRF